MRHFFYLEVLVGLVTLAFCIAIAFMLWGEEPGGRGNAIPKPGPPMVGAVPRPK